MFSFFVGFATRDVRYYGKNQDGYNVIAFENLIAIILLYNDLHDLLQLVRRIIFIHFLL